MTYDVFSVTRERYLHADDSSARRTLYLHANDVSAITLHWKHTRLDSQSDHDILGQLAASS